MNFGANIKKANERPHQRAARWMFDHLERHGVLSHHIAVNFIRKNFGDEFVYINDYDNLSIDDKVLHAFRKLNVDKNYVWSGEYKKWYKNPELDKS